MQLSPQYGTDPVILLEGDPAAIAGPAIRQRRRFAEILAGLTDEQWQHPSRCAGWSCRDVVVHLDSTNSFWTYSIAAGLRGEPTRLLGTFDPVASPAQMVAASGDPPAAVLQRFVASTEALAELLASLADDDWSLAAEAPPGHVGIDAVTHHALWDSWVHERDVLLPLGMAPAEEADEVAACLRYVAGLGPALARTRGVLRTGTLAIAAEEPEVAFVVDIGDRVIVRRDGEGTADLRLTGRAVDLVEAFSVRVPLAQPVPASAAWMLRGLSETFDVAPE